MQLAPHFAGRSRQIGDFITPFERNIDRQITQCDAIDAFDDHVDPADQMARH